MKLDLKEWEQLHARLSRMWAEGELSAALSRGAEYLASEVRAALPTGSAVAATVKTEVDGARAVVGSAAAEAVSLELGTATAAPAAFLAPAAAVAGAAVARTVAAALAEAASPAAASGAATKIAAVVATVVATPESPEAEKPTPAG